MAARITNIVATQFTAQGGNVIATLGSMGRAAGGFFGQVNNASRASERLNNQWKALGTTLRYALAGGTVFGAARLVPQLRDMQRQTGLISALSGRTAQEVTRNQNVISRNAVAALTPIDDFREGLINFYSSVASPPPINQAAAILQDISLAAQIAQTEVPEASKAITGMLNIFGQAPNRRNVQQYTRMLIDLISNVPGGPEAGRQIMQQFPTIASPVSMARGTPSQVFGLFETLLRTGGTPGQHGRGLAYLTQTIGNIGNQPKATQQAFRSIGITPDVVQEIGVARSLLIAIRAVQQRGIRGNNRGRLNAMTDEYLDSLDDSTAPSTTLGLSGPGAQLAGSLFHRVHALREFSLLITHQDQLQQDLDSMAEDFRGSAQASKKIRQQIERFKLPQQLMAAQVSIQGMRQQVLLALQPLMNLVSRQIVGAGSFVERHPQGTQHAIQASAGILAGLGVGRFLSVGGLPGMRRIPLLSGLLGGAAHRSVQANALQAALTPGGILGDSPQNPLYVTVVDQLFNSGGRSGGGTGGGGGSVEDTAAKGAIAAWAIRRAANIGGGLTRGGRAVRGAAAGLGMAEIPALGDIYRMVRNNEDLAGHRLSGTSLQNFAPIYGLFQHPEPVIGRRELRTNVSNRFRDLERQFERGQITTRQFERRADRMDAGEKTLRVVIETRDPSGRVDRRTVHLPANYWRDGRVPVLRGRAGR